MGATTLGEITLSIKTELRHTAKKYGFMLNVIMLLGTTTLSIKGLQVTIRINDTQNK